MATADEEIIEPFLSPMGVKDADIRNGGAKYDDARTTPPEKYGCFSFRPRSLQCMNSITWHVICQCVFNFFEGFVVNGVINVVLVALETRYALPSSKSSVIASANDIGAITCVVFVGYFGEQRHKPRILSLGILLMAIGCLLVSLPQFIGNKYEYVLSSTTEGNSSENMCSLGANTTCHAEAGARASDNYDLYYGLLLLGNMLLGIGASPMFTIGLSYIDENCRPNMSSFYISWTFCSAAVGVAIGYVVGGQTLTLFVDIDKLDPNSVPLVPSDPQWVGAWWIGPLISLGGFLIVAVPIFGYPRRLPNYDEVQKCRVSEVHRGLDENTAQANFGKSWKDFPKTIWLLIRNPTYIFICCGAAAEGLVIGGMATFGAKLMHERFNVSLTQAGTIMGIITIPGSGGGMLLGGYLVKRFNLKCRGIIRMCSGFMFTALLFGPFFLAHCSEDPMAGVTTPYRDQSSSSDMMAPCNADCGCTTQGYEPVCVDSTVYFSPCYAGCQYAYSHDGEKVYENCSCLVTNSTDTITTTTTATSTPLSSDPEYVITSGLCTGRCAWLYVFAAIFMIVMVFTFATMAPGVAAIFRCVPDKQRSVAIAVNLMVVRLLGLMPGPILLGTIIDTTCSVWQDTCGERGSCWVYSKYDMGVRITLWFMGLKVMGCLLFFISSVVYRPPPAEETLETVIRVPSVTARLDMNRKGYGGVDFHNSDTEPPEANTTSNNGTRL